MGRVFSGRGRGIISRGCLVFEGLSEVFSYTFGVLAHFSLGLIITGAFVIITAAVAGKALITFLRN